MKRPADPARPARRTGGSARRGLLAGAFAVLAACALALAPTAGAGAHDYLVDSSPKANSVVTTPLSTVTLTFDDIVLNLSGDGSSALLQVTGPDGAQRHFETGCPTIADRNVSAPVALGGPGKYLVTWQIVSADGHTVSDSIAFTYKPPAGTSEAKGTATRPTCGGARSGSNTTPAATDGQQNTPNASELGIVLTIGGVIVTLAIIGVVIVLLTARRTPRQPASDAGSDPDSPDDPA
jgi:Uncharacterized protein, homolog of Cu resistance protein CopC